MATARLDMISNLPDAVLCHILSFLPTKVAVATSVLSKRWTRLWLSVPTLDFEEDDDLVNFFRMVYIVIFTRGVRQSVKTFSLIANVNTLCDHSDVSTWVKAVIERGVEHLVLWLPSRINLPSGIPGSRTLVVLKLVQLSVNGVFSDGFPSLKVLILHNVSFKEHQYLMRLLSGCPFVENLHAEDLNVEGLMMPDLITGGEFQSLNKLVRAVVYFSTTYIPFKWICNVKSLRIYEDFLPELKANYTFRNLTSLELVIDLHNWIWFLEVLQHCPKLQNFEIIHTENGEDSDGFDGENWVQAQFVPDCLSSHLRTCTIRDYQGLDDCELQFSKYIMQNAKVLRTMRICSVIFSNQRAKLKLMKNLSLFPWSSATCELHLNVK